jgi:hypothetical protein
LRGPTVETDPLRLSSEPDRKAVAWKRETARLAAIGLGFLLFQWLAGMSAALVVAVGSFGVRDVRTALLLRKVDPDRARGRTCSWFYLAYACWCILVADMAYFVVLIWLAELHPDTSMEKHAISNEMTACAMIIFGCTVIGLMATWIGVLMAIRRDVRVWLHPSFRLTSGWPPGSSYGWPPAFRGSSNRAGYFLYVIKITACFVLIFGLGSLIAMLLSWREKGSLDIGESLIYSLLMAPSVALARFALSPTYRSRFQGVVASSPREYYQGSRS